MGRRTMDWLSTPALRKLTIPAPVDGVRRPSVSYPFAVTPSAIRSPKAWITGAHAAEAFALARGDRFFDGGCIG
jgi:hypothetical protein